MRRYQAQPYRGGQQGAAYGAMKRGTAAGMVNPQAPARAAQRRVRRRRRRVLRRY